MPDVRIDGEPLPRGLGLILETDGTGSRAWYGTPVSLDPLFQERRLVKTRRLPYGSRVTLGDRLVHVEGVAEALVR